MGKHVGCMVALSFATVIAGAQSLPDGFYYKFDTSGVTTPNFATPGLGVSPAPVNGQTMGGTGQFGSALIGAGGTSTTDFVDTGWPQALGNGAGPVHRRQEVTITATSRPRSPS